MTDREKVKKGLDLCLTGEPARCKDCPYDAECKEARGIGPSPLRRDALELLKEQETMVRCKDCKYWKNKYTKYIVHPWLPCMEINTSENWFCAYGERR